MSSKLFVPHAVRDPRSFREKAVSLASRIVHFLLVWSGLLFIHEYGHALVAQWQGHSIGRVTVGAGPVMWAGRVGGKDVDFRILPVVGMTSVKTSPASSASVASRGLMFGAGILLTAAAAGIVMLLSAAWEIALRRRCTWGRMIIADAVVLSVFNLFPVPPLDGGRALLDVLAAVLGAPLTGDALLWTQVSGLALAILPMTIWTSWTSRIDSMAMWWRAPRRASCGVVVMGSWYSSGACNGRRYPSVGGRAIPPIRADRSSPNRCHCRHRTGHHSPCRPAAAWR